MRDLPANSGRLSPQAWSPDGRFIALRQIYMTTGQDQVMFVDAKGQAGPVPRPIPGRYDVAGWSSADKVLISGAIYSRDSFIIEYDLTTRAQRTLAEFEPSRDPPDGVTGLQLASGLVANLGTRKPSFFADRGRWPLWTMIFPGLILFFIVRLIIATTRRIRDRGRRETLENPAGVGSSELLAQVRWGRIFVTRLGVALLMLLVSFTWLLPSDFFGTRKPPPLWMVLALGLVVVCAIGAVLFAVRTVKPLAPGLDAASARQGGVAALRSVFVLRAAVATSPALTGFFMSVVGQTTTTPFLAMLLVSVVLLAVTFPRMAIVGSVRNRLEANGTISYGD